MVGEELVFSGGFGWADLAGETRFDEATRLNIGSVSKTFTATALKAG